MRLVIDTTNPLDSKFDANFHINAKEIRHKRDSSYEYAPGHYNLTASMKITEIDDTRYMNYKPIFVELNKNKNI